LLELFSKYDLSKDSKLEINEFNKLMLEIDSKLTQEEVQYIFDKFDEDHNRIIDFDEFTKWLKANDISIQKEE
jgi:Ca2+-binding EF-hand superfamily protein